MSASRSDERAEITGMKRDASSSMPWIRSGTLRSPKSSGGPWQTLSLSTVSGDVQLSGGLIAGGSIDIDSMSGDVQLQLPTNTDASVHASSFSGDLRSDFGTPTQPEHGPGSSLDTRLGNGQGKINIETFSGDLRVRRQN